MILSVGEILTDMIAEKEGSALNLKAFVGGAPFNYAFFAKKANAKVGFLGRVGNDPIGNFIKETVKKANLDKLIIQTDNKRSTTIAFVTLSNGERDFKFLRNGTADYFIDVNGLDLQDVTTLHVGSLMLSSPYGRKVANTLFKLAKENGIKVSFDVNFRTDIYKNVSEAIKVYLPFIKKADILKFSDDELQIFSNGNDLENGLKTFAKKDKLILVTLGSKGSAYYYNGSFKVIPSKPVKPIDTTGAGDAFFGTFVGLTDGKKLDTDLIEKSLALANEQGGYATQYKGAIEL